MKDLVDHNSLWNCDIVQDWMSELLLKMRAILPPCIDHGDDTFLMAITGDGSFSVKIMYEELMNIGDQQASKVWDLLWALKVPERIRYFMWRFFHDRLMTNDNKSKCCLVYAVCKLCGYVRETGLHAIWDFPKTMQTWEKMVLRALSNSFYGHDVQLED